MIFNFLDKLSGFLDRRFILAYWAPVFLTLGLLAGVQMLHLGDAPVIRFWEGQSVGAGAVMGIALLLGITVVAYLLQALTATVVRLFEGYGWPGWLARWSAHWERKHAEELDALRQGGDSEALLAGSQFYFGFPEFRGNGDNIRPTRLGNVLTAAEQYAKEVYGIDSVLWWPRLFALLPEAFRDQIGTALTPMVALLNLSCGCVLVAFAGGAYMALYDPRWWPGIAVLAGGLLLARLCYSSAAAQAVGYGNLIRSAFDLYRSNVLEEMGLFKPGTYDDEVALWKVLNSWVYEYGTPYAHAGSEGVPAWVAAPFYYDGSAAAPAAPSDSAASSPTEYTVRIGWLHGSRKDDG